MRFGAPANEYGDTLRMANWADAGTNKLQKSRGQAAYDVLIDKLGALTESREINVYRFRKDLTFTAQKLLQAGQGPKGHVLPPEGPHPPPVAPTAGGILSARSSPSRVRRF